jgi:putative ABC transport system permease protein
MIETLWQDARFALRALGRSRGFTVAALVAPVLGIGANAAIFTVANAVLIRPLPYPEPERILGIWATAPQRGLDLTEVSYQRFSGIVDANRAFESVGAYTSDTVTLTGPEEPLPLNALRCSPGLLDVLRIKPLLGRNFLPEEDQRGGAAVVLLTHHLWRSELGSDPAIVGKPVTLDGTSHVVVGVLPADFAFPDSHVDVLVPRTFAPSFLTPGAVDRGSTYLDLVARLKPGVGERLAQGDLDRIARSDRRSAYLDAGLDYRAVPLPEQITRKVRPILLILLGAVGFVLLIACANVANLMLARAVGRRRETALRAALGAGRGRLVRQLLTESLLLSGVAGLLGLGLASWALRFLVSAAGDSIPRAAEVRLDGTVLWVTALLSLATGLAFGILPALQASRVELVEALKETRGGSPSRRSARTRSVLVVAEIAVSVVLLVGAGLLVRSLALLREVPLGFEAHHLLVARINLPPSRYGEPSRIRDFYQRLSREVAALPGVVSVGAAESLPLDGSGPQTLVAVEGRPVPDLAARAIVSFDTVTPGYFRTLGIPLLAGRAFMERDDATAPIRVVVSRMFAQRFFPGESPVGRRVLFGKNATPHEIVGVVGDVRQESLDATPVAAFYLSANQRTVATMSVVVRTQPAPLGLGGELRSRVRAIDPDQPVASLRTMEQVAESSLGDRRLTLLLLGAFAGLAFVLAGTGIYGAMAYSVSQRASEIGVRIALGARAQDVRVMVIRQGMRLAAVGVGIGLAAALGLTRVIARLLFGVSATDPLTFAAVALLLGGVALMASLVPARRASRIDPLAALRSE